MAALCLAAGLLHTGPDAYGAGDQEIPCIMTGEDVGNGYEYTAPGIGSFTVNGMEGETLQAAAFEIEEGCVPVLYRDGQEAAFESGMILDSGEYELRLYRTEERSGSYGVFRFSVENDLTEALGEGGKVIIEEDPPLTMEYDEKEKRFRYFLPDGQYFDTNVPVGGWSREQASITMSDGLNVYQVYRDGELWDASEGLNFNRTGSYEIIVRDNELGLDGEISYKLSIGFTLYLERTMDLSHINAPQGLAVAQVLLDGAGVQEAAAGDQGAYLHLEKDGEYQISFRDPQGRVCWRMEFERDTIAPYLIFAEPVDGRFLTEPVSYIPSEGNARVRILRNLEEVQAPANRIAVSGVYHVEISDEAGNTRDYDFSLRIGHSVWSIKLIIIPLFLLAAAGSAFVYWQRNMRVL